MLSKAQQLLRCLQILYCFVVIIDSTKVKQCPDNPSPLDVRVHGCAESPCDIIKGETKVFEIDFVAHKGFTMGMTKVNATVFGFTVPYELPEDVRDVCSNLMFGAYCPLYPTEDVTYLFSFPIGNYPSISLTTKIYLVDQNEEVAVCFLCDVHVKKGETRSDGGNETIVLELDWKN